MLFRTKTLSHLYPEQVWLDGLGEKEGPSDAEHDSQPAPRFVRPSTTSYKLRLMEGRAEAQTQPPSMLARIIDFFSGHRGKAA
jgi:hypothetical protein